MSAADKLKLLLASFQLLLIIADRHVEFPRVTVADLFCWEREASDMYTRQVCVHNACTVIAATVRIELGRDHGT